jgi:hypothetical protein
VLFDADVQHLLGQRCSSLVATAGVRLVFRILCCFNLLFSL